MKNKRIIALALAAGIAVSGSGIGAMAEATRTSFDFTVKAEKSIPLKMFTRHMMEILHQPMLLHIRIQPIRVI